MKLHLSQSLHQRRDTIVIQYDLMHLVELRLLVVIQHASICVTQQPAQSFTNLALYSNRDVLLDEVLDHSEVVLVCASHFLEDAIIYINLSRLLFEVF